MFCDIKNYYWDNNCLGSWGICYRNSCGERLYFEDSCGREGWSICEDIFSRSGYGNFTANYSDGVWYPLFWNYCIYGLTNNPRKFAMFNLR